MLINKKAVRHYILAQTNEHRKEWGCSRVSEAALLELDGWLREKINKAVHRHPTRGKTFTEVY